MTRLCFFSGLVLLLVLLTLGCSAAQPTATPPSPTPAAAASDPTAAPTPGPASAYPPAAPTLEPANTAPYPVPTATAPNTAAYDIKGNISDVQAATQEGQLGRIRVEGEKIQGNKYTRAVVTITQDTRIREQKDGQLVDATFEALEFGELVQVTFSGPVLESFPVQAGASEVIILNHMPRN